jgi:hypothetical protein
MVTQYAEKALKKFRNEVFSGGSPRCRSKELKLGTKKQGRHWAKIPAAGSGWGNSSELAFFLRDWLHAESPLRSDFDFHNGQKQASYRFVQSTVAMQPVGSKEHTRHTETDSLLRWIESGCQSPGQYQPVGGTEYTRVCTTDQTDQT